MLTLSNFKIMITNTSHTILIGDAASKMADINDESISLIVTSPPYPMVEMWDDILASQNENVKVSQQGKNGDSIFEYMHQELDKVWQQMFRVLQPGGFACINIGDATRTINERFSLYNNHSRITSCMVKLGFANMPNIIWRKQTNAPNKFMGSGMLPAGAYVTLEHEWILIFRKADKREFKTDAAKQLRKESAFFWEERNIWFSDMWDIKGTKQNIESAGTRSRSAAYPFELPYRLINMYSVKGDTVLDPYLGTGTTSLAAIASERNSIGIEIDQSFLQVIGENITGAVPGQLNRYIQKRIDQHKGFVDNRSLDLTKNSIKHFNENLNLPVMTLQETEMRLSFLNSIENSENNFTASYIEVPKTEHFKIKQYSLPQQEVMDFD